MIDFNVDLLSQYPEDTPATILGYIFWHTRNAWIA